MDDLKSNWTVPSLLALKFSKLCVDSSGKVILSLVYPVTWPLSKVIELITLNSDPKFTGLEVAEEGTPALLISLCPTVISFAILPFKTTWLPAFKATSKVE